MAAVDDLTVAAASGSAPAEAPVAATAHQEVVAALPAKRPRGRPKGSKNKPKVDNEGATKKARSTTKSRAKDKQDGGPLEQVHSLLRQHGVTAVSKVSKCLKAGILHGFVKLVSPEEDPEREFGLDQILLEGGCIVCDEEITCTIRDVLYQPDYGGDDYEDGGEAATVHCEGEECDGLGLYVTNICSGQPSFDSGKFHNHCKSCPQFGICIGDYREVHCKKCGGHYFAGGFGGKCYNCPKKR